MNEETAWIAARSIGFLGRVSTVERQNEPFGDIRTSVGDARFSSADRKRDFETGSKRIRRPRGTLLLHLLHLLLLRAEVKLLVAAGALRKTIYGPIRYSSSLSFLSARPGERWTDFFRS